MANVPQLNNSPTFKWDYLLQQQINLNDTVNQLQLLKVFLILLTKTKSVLNTKQKFKFGLGHLSRPVDLISNKLMQ